MENQQKPTENLTKPRIKSQKLSDQPTKNLGGRPRKEQPSSMDTQEKRVKKYIAAHPDCTIAGMTRELGYASGLDFIKDAKKTQTKLYVLHFPLLKSTTNMICKAGIPPGPSSH